MNASLADELAKSGEAVKAGPIGLAVILLLCIACYFLFKSMSKHLRNVRENFPDGAAPPEPPAEPPAAPPTTTAARTSEETKPTSAPD